MGRQHRGDDIVDSPAEIPRGGFEIAGGRRGFQRMIGDGNLTRTRERPARRPRLVTADDGHREHGRPRRARQAERSRFEPLETAIMGAPALRKDQHRFTGLKEAQRFPRRPRIGAFGLHGEGPEPPDHSPEHGNFKEPAPGHVVEGAPDRDCDQHRVGVRDVVGGYDNRTRSGDVLDSVEGDRKVRLSREPDERPEAVNDWGAHFLIMSLTSFTFQVSSFKHIGSAVSERYPTRPLFRRRETWLPRCEAAATAFPAGPGSGRRWLPQASR